MNGSIQTIKERLSIVDVISSYLSVEQSGKNYKARCPFHNEKTPSFFISPDRGSYYCFGCGAKGDIFSFVEHFEGVDFMGSLKLLAARAGVTLDTHASSSNTDEKERLYAVMEEATLFFASSLQSKPEARAYLLDRGLSLVTLESFRVGFAPDSWRSVSDHLLSRGYTKDELELVGLIKKTDSGFYDRFRSRIIFPISDSSGRVIAFSGRIFGKEGTEEAKYLNSPDTPLFNKSHVLFGIDKAKTSIRTRGYSIVVEGQMDLLLCHQAGFTNTVAVSGTAFTDSVEDTESKITNFGLIRRLSPNIIFAFDGDSAGIRATSRAAMIALSLDMQVKTTTLPEGKDPADIIRENEDTWKECVKGALNIVSFHTDRICRETGDIRTRGRKIREIIFPFLRMVSSAIERSAYVHEITTKTGISEDAVREDFALYEKSIVPPKEGQRSSYQEHTVPALEKTSRKKRLEERFFGVLFWGEENEFVRSKITEHSLTIIRVLGEDECQSLRTLYEPKKSPLSFEVEMWYGDKIEALVKDLEEITLNLEEEILYEKRQDLQPLDTEEKLVAHTNITKRIEEIKHHRSQK